MLAVLGEGERVDEKVKGGDQQMNIKGRMKEMKYCTFLLAAGTGVGTGAGVRAGVGWEK